MRLGRGLLCLLLVAPALGGCLGSTGPGTGEPVPSADITYACPGETASASPCWVEVSALGEGFSEPTASAHPEDTGMFVVAATRTGRVEERNAGNPPGEEAPNLCRVVVHVTEDGGSTWRAREPALPPWGLVDGEPVRDRCTRAPDVTFDATGTLHLVLHDFARTWTASVAGAAGDRARLVHRVLHLSSVDLGETWTSVVLREESNHPYIAFDASTGVLAATVRGFAGDGFSESAITWSHDGGATWRGPATVPCHLPTRAVFEDGHAIFACTDHDAMEDGRLIRLYALDPARGTVEALAEVPVPGARNLFTALAGAPDGPLALAWTLTVPGGGIAGDPYVATASRCCAFGAATNLRAAVAPTFENAMWTTLRADARGVFHFGIEAWQEADAVFVHGTLGPDGSVEASAVGASWTWAAWPPTEVGDDPVEELLGAWRGSLYPAFAFQGEAGVLASTANGESVLRVARIAVAGGAR